MSTKIIRVYIVFAFTRDKIENHFERGQLPLQTQKWKFFLHDMFFPKTNIKSREKVLWPLIT